MFHWSRVTPPARRRPAKLARETMTLDHLSGGRLVLGVGLGEPADGDFSQLGDEGDAVTRAAMLDEALEVLIGMWSGEAFSHHGGHYMVEGQPFLPPPVQRPRIPIWVAGTWPNKGPFRRAARFDGVYPLADDNGMPTLITPPGVREVVANIAEQRSDMDGYDVSAAIVLTGDTGEDRRRIGEFEDAGVTWAHIGPAGEGETFEDVADNKTLDAEDVGKVINVTADAKTITLPAVSAGLEYVIRNGGASGTVEVTVSPNAVDKIMGADLAGVDDKDRINTKATAIIGDYIHLIYGGATGWMVVAERGTWAAEA